MGHFEKIFNLANNPRFFGWVGLNEISGGPAGGLLAPTSVMDGH